MLFRHEFLIDYFHIENFSQKKRILAKNRSLQQQQQQQSYDNPHSIAKQEMIINDEELCTSSTSRLNNWNRDSTSFRHAKVENYDYDDEQTLQDVTPKPQMNYQFSTPGSKVRTYKFILILIWIHFDNDNHHNLFLFCRNIQF